MPKIINNTRNTVIALTAWEAKGFFGRLTGLLGSSKLSEGAALIIKHCHAIHTFGMRYPIDIIFVDKSNRAIRAIPDLKPWRCSPFVLRASLVIELPAGTMAKSKCELGDQLSFS